MNTSKYELKRLSRYMMIVVLLVVQVACFSYVWFIKYRNITLIHYRSIGNVAMIGLYAVLLLVFTYNLGGAKYGLLKRNNISFSQGMAIVLSNICISFVIILLTADVLSIGEIFLMTIVQVAFVIGWNALSYKILNQIFPPRKLLLLYDNYSPEKFENKVRLRNDKYYIAKICRWQEFQAMLESKELFDYEGVILFDIQASARNRILKKCYYNSVRVYSTIKISDILMKNAEELNLFDTQLALVREYELTFEQKIMKRIMDITISALALVILSPLMLFTALCIKCYDGGTVFFTQERYTKNFKVFKIHKFRSMIMDAEKPGQVIPATDHDPRITPIGRFIRATRIDELPQLFDILVGNMSIVGPRPERIEHVDKYCREVPEFGMRLKVKGGLTGYAQVYGKYNTSAYDKLKLDLSYISNYSLMLDLKIVLLTLRTVFQKESTEGFEE
ncbi:MAG: sugar transferase [Lachnospiraceae bacterium]|nr:sugar transferase [Lachnospiraceae bacterium]